MQHEGWEPAPIPPEQEQETIDGDACYCSPPARRIHCFIKPDFGT